MPAHQRVAASWDRRTEGKAAKQVILEYFDRLLNQRDLGACDELLSPLYIDHDNC